MREANARLRQLIWSRLPLRAPSAVTPCSSWGEEERTARPRDWLTSIYVALSPDTLDVKGVASCSLICRSFRLALGAIRFP